MGVWTLSHNASHQGQWHTMSGRGTFIVIEGLDRLGKSPQTGIIHNKVVERLGEQGGKLIEFPGKWRWCPGHCNETRLSFTDARAINIDSPPRSLADHYTLRPRSDSGQWYYCCKSHVHSSPKSNSVIPSIRNSTLLTTYSSLDRGL